MVGTTPGTHKVCVQTGQAVGYVFFTYILTMYYQVKKKKTSASVNPANSNF